MRLGKCVWLVAAAAMLIVPVARANNIDCCYMQDDEEWLQISAAGLDLWVDGDFAQIGFSGQLKYVFDESNGSVADGALGVIGKLQNVTVFTYTLSAIAERTGPSTFRITLEGDLVLEPGVTLDAGLMDVFLRDLECWCCPDDELGILTVTDITQPGVVPPDWMSATVNDPGGPGWDAEPNANDGLDVQFVGIDIATLETNPIVIDMECVPEPATAALLLLAGVPALLRRRARA